MWRRQIIEIGEPDERYGQTRRLRGSLRTEIPSTAKGYESDSGHGSDDRRMNRRASGAVANSANLGHRQLILSGEAWCLLRGQACFAPHEDVRRLKCASPVTRDGRAERSGRPIDHGAEGPYGARAWRRGGGQPASFPRSDANWRMSALACSMRRLAVVASVPQRSKKIAPLFSP
jgi:hypothetical protein